MPPAKARLRQALRSLPPQLRLAAALAVAALASAIYSAVSSQRSAISTAPAVLPNTPDHRSAAVPPTPDTPIQAAFEAARKGDLDGYLAQFADPLRTQLARTRAEKGDAYLRDYLARLTAPLKGIAVDLTRKEEVGPDTLRLPVQFIYADRNELQPFLLRRDGARWRILRIESLRSAPTLIPYGTPIQQVR